MFIIGPKRFVNVTKTSRSELKPWLWGFAKVDAIDAFFSGFWSNNLIEKTNLVKNRSNL